MEGVASGLSCVSPLSNRNSSRRRLCLQASSTSCRAQDYRKNGLDLRTDFTCSCSAGSLHGSFSGVSLRTVRDNIDQAIPCSRSRKGIITMVVGSFLCPAKNGSYALKHPRQKPERSLSRGENLRVRKTFLGSVCHFKGAQHAAQKVTLSSLICRITDSQSSEWEREEARWLREEKRWIREEERWHREEARWTAERKDLLEQIATYREQIKALKLEIAIVVPSTKTTTPGSLSGTKGLNWKLSTSDMKVHTPVSPGPERATSKAESSSPKKAVNTVVEASSTRVYLLGENRWEEPDRLLGKNGPIVATAVAQGLSERCIGCKGQGNMMCTECEGTGELNVEEQFLEWADEGAKCPYCEGKGVLDCDICDGKGVTALT